TLFTLSASELLLMTLHTPGGTEITPSNYASIPGLTVEYNEEFYFQSNIPEEVENASQPRLRVVLAATHANWMEVNISLNGEVLLSNLRLDDAAPSDYFPIDIATYTVSVAPSAGGTPVSATLSAEANGDYTLLLSGDDDTPDLNVLTDDLSAPSAQGKARLRFIHSAPYTNAVDVFVGGTQVMDNGNYLDHSAYLELSTGTVQVEIKDATNQNLIAPVQSILLTSGGVYTLFDAALPSGSYPLAWSQLLDRGYNPRYLIQYKVWAAPNGMWNVDLEGNLDTSLPFVAAMGFANPTTANPTLADASQDPMHPVLSYTATSDYLPATISVYANPGDYYDSSFNWLYQGIEIAEFTLTDPQDVSGNLATYTLDFSSLESGEYTLWTHIDNGVTPPHSAYVPNAALMLAFYDIDQSATFPGAWNPTITTQVNNSQFSLSLNWDGLTHPDVDSYTLYFGTQPGAPATYTTGLTAYRDMDANGQLVGPLRVGETVSNLQPGIPYYYSVEAVDAESGRTVRSPEYAITIPDGDFNLTTSAPQYLTSAGTQVSFPLSLQVLQPLFYSNVGLSIDSSLTPPGMRVWFDSALDGDDFLNAASDTVQVIVDLGEDIPDGIYPITFVGSSGNLKRSLTVNILVNVTPTDLQIDGNYQVINSNQVTFTFTVANSGSSIGDGAVVSIPFTDDIVNLAWQCTGSGGATCGSGTGDVYDIISHFPPGTSVTYTITGELSRYLSFHVTGSVSWWTGGDLNLNNNQITLDRFVLVLSMIFKNTTP
ncbi:MAG TPA: DUF4397 domain-containing protein, partial [Anaerolineaceae bacterium]|nr:DUF4397 domain-containing protein [Anaerolineaceae bacterium]